MRCPLYSVRFIEFSVYLLGKWPEPQVAVRLSEVSGLEHVRFKRGFTVIFTIGPCELISAFIYLFIEYS